VALSVSLKLKTLPVKKYGTLYCPDFPLSFESDKAIYENNSKNNLKIDYKFIKNLINLSLI
tara:strand:- start:416 stop:598 length:183 start_codon:yes stop_codon:yes gene_type:complete